MAKQIWLQAVPFVWILLACLSTRVLLSEPAPTPKTSTLAPAADLIDQVDFFIGRVTEALSDPAEFPGARQSRTLKDANTLAVLALVLGQHDEAHALKASMPALLDGARQLAAADEDYAKAQAAFELIQAARTGKSAGGEIKWNKSASLPLLMKQVPLVHAPLKRGVDGSRLARNAKQAAGQSATLVAIAIASQLDDSYAKSPEQVTAWNDCCVEMRDAAGEVNSAVHAQDAARVSTGMKRLQQSCDACHAKFQHK